MKFRVLVFLLCATLLAYAQRPGGRPSGPPSGSMGGPPSGTGTGSTGTGMGSSRGHGEGSGAGMASRPSDIGRQTPDAVLTRNTKLSSRLQSMLPNGMTAQQACSGFKNLGQCVAAIHVANNLDIPFADLKAKMTGGSAESLGKAIQDLKPQANAKSEAKKAQKQANSDLRESES